MKFVIGLIFFLVGLALSVYYKKTNEIINLPIGWAERYLGSTAYAYFIFGIAGILIGLMIMFNIIDLGFFGI